MAVTKPQPQSTDATKTDQPLIIQYTNLLHEWRDVDATAVQEFLREHSNDKVFLKRAQVVNKLFKIKESARV